MWSSDQEGTFYMGRSRSPARSTSEDGFGSNSPSRESHQTELDGDLLKSSMKDRFLSDPVSVSSWSVRSRAANRSPMTERGSSGFGFGGVGKSTESLRNAGKSPLREIGGRTPVSVRTRHVRRSPVRDVNVVSKSLVSSSNGDIPNSQMRGYLISNFDENVETAERRRTRMNRFGDGVDQIDEGRECIFGSEPGMAFSEGSVDDPFHGVDPNKGIMHRDLRFRGDNVGEYANSKGSIDQWVTGGEELGVEHKSCLGPSSSVDGPLCYHPDSSIYGHHNFVTVRKPTSFQELEVERAELLRKYKELKDQLSDLKNTNTPFLVPYGGPGDYSKDESWRFRQESEMQFALNKGVKKAPYFNHDLAPVDDLGDLYNYHAPLYDDPYLGQMARRPYSKQSYQFLKRSVPGHIPGRSLDFDLDSPKSYHDIILGNTRGWSMDFDHDSSYLDETHYHHPACSCTVCYVRKWQRQDLSNSLADKMSVTPAANLRSSHSMHLDRCVPRPYNPRMAQTNPRERPSHLAHRHPTRTLVTTLNKRLCHPIAGGSPFILCCKCFRLLNLPGKLMQKNQDQLQCGACSAIMSFDLKNRSFGPFPSQRKVNDVTPLSGFGEVLKEPGPKHRRAMTATSTNIGSYDFDAVGCGFQSMDSEPSRVSKGQRLSSCSADNIHCPSPYSSRNSRSSKEECTSDTASIQSSLSTCAEKPSMNLVHPTIGSPLEDHLEYSNCFQKLHPDGKKNNADEEKVLRKDLSFEGSLENADIHSHESLSIQDPGEVENKAANIKDKHSSITGFMKWGFATKSGRKSPERAEVYVNGQPIPHRGVKRAEKLAGPVQPGEYWYDSKAGFWGVIGHQCLGIIPSSIQEFSFPMPENCSDGDTAIYVNGRELSKKDLDLLASRGLPTQNNKNYIIDISGKVVEEKTREFVVNLGRLAPTVERNRRGYGMQVPDKLDD